MATTATNCTVCWRARGGVPGDITWNFEKFLVGKDGRVLARFAPRTAPDDPVVVQAIEKP